VAVVKEVPHMKTIAPHILNLAVDGDEWSVSRSSRSTPGTHSIGGWVGPRAGLDTAMAKIKSLCPCRFQPVAQSLYRLSYMFTLSEASCMCPYDGLQNSFPLSTGRVPTGNNFICTGSKNLSGCYRFRNFTQAFTPHCNA